MAQKLKELINTKVTIVDDEMKVTIVDDEMKVDEVERLCLKDNNLQDEDRVELEKIYRKLNKSLSKGEKETNKTLIKFSNCLCLNQN